MAKYCPECGSPAQDGARFCESCGAELGSPSEQGAGALPEQSAVNNVTPNIVLGEDGKYRWIYEMSLFKNPTVFITVWKIFFYIAVGMFVFISIIQLAEGNMDGEMALNMLKVFGIALGGMTALVVVSCLIYAAIMGGKYVVVFTLDENGIDHTQIPSQAKKARGIATATLLIGLATGSRAAIAGSFAASNSSMYTPFAKTRKVRFYPRRDLIKIRTRLFRNQVYVKPEDFDFVRSYILARVPDSAKSGPDA